MKKVLLVLLSLNLSVSTLSAQSQASYSDQYLSRSFKVFQMADFQMAYHILPFLRARFKQELADTSSFRNPFDSLSKYMDIRWSSDSLVKTYCWNEHNGSCCYTSANFVQFRTPRGQIKMLDLESPDDEGAEYFISDLQRLEKEGQAYYLLLGWGSCCGGKHYQVAKLYQITEATFILVQNAFADAQSLFIEANRSQEIALQYSPETQILSYNRYTYNEETGFYQNEKIPMQWQWGKKGFQVLQ